MSLMTKHRPQEFAEVIGHKSTKDILKSKLSKEEHPHCYLFAGESGLGKTTFARIIAKSVDAEAIEFDAGNLTGVDSIRDLISESSTVSIMSGKAKKCFIIDECHMLSKSSWNALLKTIEEPGKYTYFVFCTTELNKVPAAIKNQRCVTLKLNPLTYDDMIVLLENISDLDTRFIDFIAQNAEGSPRKALNMLESAIEMETDFNGFKKSVNDGMYDNIEEHALAIARELCQATVNKKVLIDNLKEIKNFEGARIQIFNYLTSVCMKNDKLYERLICFSDPIVSNSTGKGELLIKLLMARSL